KWFVRDLESRNGTLVNGQRVAVTELSGGEEILIGGTRLTFALAPIGMPAAEGPTKVTGAEELAPPGPSVDVFSQMAAETPQPTPSPAAAPTAAATAAVVVEGRPGEGKVFILQHPTNTIGSSYSSRIFLPDPTVSRLHARIVRDGEVYWIEDMKSASGVIVNGKHVRKVALGNNAVITLGTVTMRFLYAPPDLAQGLQPPTPAVKRPSETSMEGVVHAIAMTVEMRDPYTAGHQRRVSKLAQAIAAEMGLPKDQVEGVRVSGILHDLGKISVPGEILSKPGRMSKGEMDIIKTHPHAGYEILKGITFPWPVAQIVLQHHERMDGSGYGAGLRGNDILPEARILGVADVVEAMASHRPYRPALGIDRALDEIRQRSGTIYWSDAVKACIELFTQKGFKLE
ncbi:MAG: FHA domain-containing protein, partial [Planctomycetes bacterium]|nr:FHA domain-containing protein [Planctomycetota bacterium]